MIRIIIRNNKSYHYYDTYHSRKLAHKWGLYFKEKAKSKYWIETVVKGIIPEKVHELYLTKVQKAI